MSAETAGFMESRREGPFMAHILVVDDEPIIAMTMSDWLSDLGHTVVGPATELASALEFAEQNVDAAILDVSLGLETTIAVARRLAERKIPVVVASGHDENSIGKEFKSVFLLPKPFGFEGFRRAVERLLASSSS